MDGDFLSSIQLEHLGLNAQPKCNQSDEGRASEIHRPTLGHIENSWLIEQQSYRLHLVEPVQTSSPRLVQTRILDLLKFTAESTVSLSKP